MLDVRLWNDESMFVFGGSEARRWGAPSEEYRDGFIMPGNEVFNDLLRWHG